MSLATKAVSSSLSMTRKLSTSLVTRPISARHGTRILHPLTRFRSPMRLADSSESQLCRKRLSLGVNIRARGLSTIQDSTSQKFLLLGQLSRQDSTSEGRYVSLFLDFAPMGRRKCDENDFEKWYARTIKNKECLMGHRVCACPIKDVKMWADGHGIAMVQAPQGWRRLLRRRQVH
jgi:Sortilin, neurotensin receptor 3, C-terminal